MLTSPSLKNCTKCHSPTDLTEFYTSPKARDGLHQWCKECQRAASRAWDRSPKGQRQRRATHVKRAYGVTIEWLDEMLIEQGGVCAICKADEPGGKGGFHVDHDHVTGKVRGLLCHDCNVGLGCFRDSEEMVVEAAAYLRKASA